MHSKQYSPPHTSPYKSEQLEGMIRRTLANLISVHLIDGDTKKRILEKDPDIEKRISEEVVYLSDLQISCLTGTLLLEFDAHHNNHFAVYMAMAVHIRSMECVK